MNGGAAERTMMEDIKRQIKESYRRRRSRGSSPQLQKSQPDGHGINASIFTPSPARALQSLASSVHSQENPIPSNDISEASYPQKDTIGESQDRFDAYFVADVGSTDTQNPETYQSLPDDSYSVSASPRSNPGTRISVDERELNLVMYYLDHIFPRLAPYFKYSAADNGRGWLLNLFLRTKPLYTAAVCLSACDKAQFVLGPLSDIAQPYHELEMQHLRSVADLRDHLDQLSKRTGASQTATGVEALACIMHLIFFEVCTT